MNLNEKRFFADSFWMHSERLYQFEKGFPGIILPFNIYLIFRTWIVNNIIDFVWIMINSHEFLCLALWVMFFLVSYIVVPHSSIYVRTFRWTWLPTERWSAVLKIVLWFQSLDIGRKKKESIPGPFDLLSNLRLWFQIPLRTTSRVFIGALWIAQ